MWALGVLAYALICAQFPFGRVQTKIMRGAYARPPLDAAGAGAAAREFVAAALVIQLVLEVPSTDSEDAAPPARLVPSRAQAAPTQPRAPLEQLGSPPWPQRSGARLWPPQS